MTENNLKDFYAKEKKEYQTIIHANAQCLFELEKKFIDSTPREDLPLYFNVTWISNKASDYLNQRIRYPKGDPYGYPL